MSGLKALFGGASATPAAVALPAPTPVAPPPDRSNADIQAAGAAQRARFFGAQPGVSGTSFTGGTGTNAGSSSVVSFLGNVGRQQ